MEKILCLITGTMIMTVAAALSGTTSDLDSTCGPGHYLRTDSGGESCVPCPDGRYMNEDNHRNIHCRICSKAESWRREVVLHNCSKTSDTVIGCDEYSYRRADVECILCTVCGIGRASGLRYTARYCTKDKDTLCCAKPTEMSHDYGNGTVGCKDFGGQSFEASTDSPHSRPYSATSTLGSTETTTVKSSTCRVRAQKMETIAAAALCLLIFLVHVPLF